MKPTKADKITTVATFLDWGVQMSFDRLLLMVEHPLSGEYVHPEDVELKWDWMMLLVDKVSEYCRESPDSTSYFDKTGYCLWHRGDLYVTSDIDHVFEELYVFVNMLI